MSIRNRRQQIELLIEKLSKRGNGIGSFERQDHTTWPVEVPFTIPGDRVKATLLRKRSGVYRSLFEGIITPSPDRIEPRCIHFGVCGGCRWQQITYQKQLEIKEGVVRHAFRDLLDEDTEWKPIIPCSSHWNYRNKMEFSFSSDASKKNYLGLVIDSSKGRVFNVKECHLPNRWFVDAVETVRRWWSEFGLDAYHSRHNTGSLRTLTLREGQRTGDRMVMLTVSGNPKYALTKQHLESFVAFLRETIEPDDPEQKLSIFLKIHQAQKGRPTEFYEMHLYGPDHIRERLTIKTDPLKEPETLTFNISPAAFFQPNTRQAEEIYSQALQMTRFSKDEVVYDLYCGTGTLGICIAKRAKEVVGIELSPEAAIDARANAEQNGLNNVAILTGSVQEKLEEIRREELYSPPDLVMVDPPRAGLDPEALAHLKKLKPPRILYISCHPKTQAENSAELVAEGYKIHTVQPIDQFPHTVHIENLVLLTHV